MATRNQLRCQMFELSREILVNEEDFHANNLSQIALLEVYSAKIGHGKPCDRSNCGACDWTKARGRPITLRKPRHAFEVADTNR